MLPVGQNRPTQETQIYETRLSSFKVNELQTLLSTFRVQKIGKKNELYSRCVELLRTPNLTKTVIDKIREIEQRVNPQRANPYPLPTMSHNHNNYQQQQQQNMYGRPNGGMSGYNGYMSNMSGYAGMGGMQHNMNNGLMSNITPRPARNLTAMPLPFYDPIMTVVEPQELPPNTTNNNKMPAKMEIQFTLSPEVHMKLSVRDNEFPRTEVQLRFFNSTGDILNIEQPDDFPLNCAVKINDANVTLPNVIPTNKPNQEPKRPSRPVNITQQVINAPRDKKHMMRIDWSADKRQWAVAIYVVTRVNSDILRNRILKSPSYELPYATTEATIRKRLGGGDDDDVAMDSLKISLLCPLMKTRMKIAARCRDCTHLQCFDLDSYLMLNEKKPAWKCGVCNNSAPYHKLIIDKYFMKMLNDLGPLVTDVELLKDGNYRVIKEDDICDISDDDDCMDDVKPAVCTATMGGGSKSSSIVGGMNGGGGAGSSTAPVTAGVAKIVIDDCITLSDDEEHQEEADLRNAIRASMPVGSIQQMPRTPPRAPASPPSDDSIIILDDTPPRPEPISSRMDTAPSSSSSIASCSSGWRPVTSSPVSSGPASVPTTTTTSAASTVPVIGGGGGASTSSGGGGGGSGGYGQQRAQITLADALGQAGHRPSGGPSVGLVPPQLQLNVPTPLSAAAISQHSLYNWNSHQQQQQPQSAPPMMNNGHQWGHGYGGMNGGMNYPPLYAQHQMGYGGGPNLGMFGGANPPWNPPNGGPPLGAYQQNGGGGGGVIRRNDDGMPRDLPR